MISTTVNLTTETKAKPSAKVYAMPNGERFIAIQLAHDVSVILPGVDGLASDYAIRLSEVLIEATGKLIAEAPAPAVV